MSDSTEISPDDLILAEFVRELDREGVNRIDLQQWIENNPHMEERFRGFLNIHVTLEIAREPDENQIPAQLGEFKILRRIAGGGMGDVYEALQTSLDRKVAVKTIRNARLSSELEQRFLREQKVLGALHQTHIVPIHTAGNEAGLQYFAMPCIEGAAMSHLVGKLGSHESSRTSGKTPGLGQLARADTKDAQSEDASTGSVNPQEGKGETSERPRGVNRLSEVYLTSVAHVMADVAEAVHHAHECQILHRDIKPSNIMVDSKEQCWIIDFGLAKYLHESDDDIGQTNIPRNSNDFQTQAHFVGTPAYMAPEQFEGKADVQTDVYGLGVTLYELLTLQKPFQGKTPAEFEDSVCHTNPPRPKLATRGLPVDLEAICLKAMRKKPAHRYLSAADFAADLRRFLNGEPIEARPARVSRRVWKWAKRNKGWASAIVLLLVALLVFAWSGFAIAKTERRESLISEAQRIQSSSHVDGWSNEALSRIRDAVKIDKDASLRHQAASLFAGIDARRIREFKFGSGHLAFDQKSNQLLMTGYFVSRNRHDLETKLWPGELAAPEALGAFPPGPVTFNTAGEPMQLYAMGGEVILENLKKGTREVRQTPAPRTVDEDSDQQSVSPTSIALATAGDAFAAVYPPANKSGENDIFVWKSTEPTPVRIKQSATKITLSNDGSLLGTTDSRGTITIWKTSDGAELVRFRSGVRNPSVLKFSASASERDFNDRKTLAARSTLAIASSGRIGLFNLPSAEPVSVCSGFHDEIHGVSFSPDGVLLASCGRVYASLWDVSTGAELLRFNHANTMTDIEFSPDGKRIAVSHMGFFEDQQGGVRIWELEFGRGIDLLRGLRAPVGFAVFSPNEKFIAALSQDWEVAVWEINTRRLLRVFRAPPGYFTDNAALRFSADEQHLAFSSGRAARLWEVSTGNEIGHWDLPPGLQDELAFQPSGDLYLFRMEAESGTDGFLQGVSPEEDPRICRLRRLIPGQPPVGIRNDSTFNHHVFSIVTTPDSKYFVAEGVGIPPSPWKRAVAVFDTGTGERNWGIPTQKELGSALLAIEPESRFFAYDVDGGETAHVVELESGRLNRFFKPATSAFHLGSRFSVRQGPGSRGFELLHMEENAPLVILLQNQDVSPLSPEFGRNGRSLIWGNMDGTVAVCDLDQVLQRLTEIGLSW